ncbi:MAG TPA: hypothetical protein PKA13_13365 [Geminicoccaceae bacterium]|nr:hypothetical protein [Geminicoccaceae bacterium]
MTSGESVISHLSFSEVAEAIRALPEAGWVRLRKIAGAFCRNKPLDPADLLQEAFVRVLGDRQCPRHVDVIRFLAETMRSIVSDGAKGQKRRDARARGAPPDLRLVPATGEGLAEPEDDTPSIEDQLASHQEAVRIRAAIVALFADDVQAQVIAEGMMEEMDGEELRALTELDTKAFASKRRLVRRRIDKAHPNGWKP